MKRLKSLLVIPGMLYLVTRFGSSTLRRWAFDQKHSDGSWDRINKECSLEMVQLVEKYTKKGRILDIGCGTGILARKLNTGSFESYVGIDVSPEAITQARKLQSDKIFFEISDIQSYNPNSDYDLMIFKESLYYIPFSRRRLLQRYAKHLRPNGVFIITIADPHRFAHIIKMIRQNFQIIEDRCFQNSNRWLLIFR